MAPTFRLMKEEDLAEVMEINELVYPTVWSASFFKQQLRQTDSRVNIVFELENKVVGHGALMKVADEAHVISLVVHPLHQKKGIGISLLSVLCHHAVGMGLKSMTSEDYEKEDYEKKYIEFNNIVTPIMKKIHQDQGMPGGMPGGMPDMSSMPDRKSVV